MAPRRRSPTKVKCFNLGLDSEEVEGLWHAGQLQLVLYGLDPGELWLEVLWLLQRRSLHHRVRSLTPPRAQGAALVNSTLRLRGSSTHVLDEVRWLFGELTKHPREGPLPLPCPRPNAPCTMPWQCCTRQCRSPS